MKKPVHSYTIFLPKIGEVRLTGKIKNNTDFYTNRFGYDKMVGIIVQSHQKVLIRYDLERSAEDRPNTFGFIYIVDYAFNGQTYSFYGLRAMH